MGSVYEQFSAELASWAQQYRDDPKGELQALCLLSLEREQMVTVAYSEEMLKQRVLELQVPDDVRDLIRQALLWAWKDEQMHAIYIRGALLKMSGKAIGWQTFAHQVMGAVAGWASAVEQHGEGGLAHGVARAVVHVGQLMGKVPLEAQRQLQHSSFTDFCRFNVDAERTAELCWSRLVELAHSHFPEAVEDFERIRQHEANHTRIFDLLSQTVDEADCLRPGVRADTLRKALAPYLPPRIPAETVYVRQGSDKLALFDQLLEPMQARLTERAARVGKPVYAMRIACKTTFMLGYDRRDLSPIVDPDLLMHLARWLEDRGIRERALLDARNPYDHFFSHRSVRKVADYFGISSWRIVDPATDQVPHPYSRGFGQSSISRTWKEADFRVVFGKLRSHPVDMVLLTVGALEGLGASHDRFLFYERQAHREDVNVGVLHEHPADFALLDGFENIPDGLVGVMGSKHPRRPQRFYASRNPLALDIVAARHAGVRNPRASSLLRTAIHWSGEPEIKVDGTDSPIPGWRTPFHSFALLGLVAYGVYVFASGRGTLFVPAMDEQAFPPRRRPPWWLRLARRGVRWLLGLPR
ncbi:MAG: DUF362 domain-containing protein [Candidatus Xenobia bacterium]